jgi:hypothetical protein
MRYVFSITFSTPTILSIDLFTYSTHWCANTHTHTHARTHARTHTRTHTHTHTCINPVCRAWCIHTHTAYMTTLVQRGCSMCICWVGEGSLRGGRLPWGYYFQINQYLFCGYSAVILLLLFMLVMRCTVHVNIIF